MSLQLLYIAHTEDWLFFFTSRRDSFKPSNFHLWSALEVIEQKGLFVIPMWAPESFSGILESIDKLINTRKYSYPTMPVDSWPDIFEKFGKWNIHFFFKVTFRLIYQCFLLFPPWWSLHWFWFSLYCYHFLANMAFEHLVWRLLDWK